MGLEGEKEYVGPPPTRNDLADEPTQMQSLLNTRPTWRLGRFITTTEVAARAPLVCKPLAPATCNAPWRMADDIGTSTV